MVFAKSRAKKGTSMSIHPETAPGRQRALDLRGLISASVAATVWLAALPASAQQADATVELTGDLTFEPASLTIEAGETVEWRNVSDLPHTVTADPDIASDPDHVELPEGAEAFDSGFLQSGDVYRRTFDVPGEYRYFCIPHEGAGMVATLTVE